MRKLLLLLPAPALAIASLPFTLPMGAKAVSGFDGFVWGTIDVTHKNSCVD